MSDGPSAPGTGELRARRHPWAIAAVWAWETAVALYIAWPAATLAREAYGGDPRGDEVLWDPGAHALLALATRDAHAVSVVLANAVVALGGAAIASVVATAALLVAVASPGPLRGRGLPWMSRRAAVVVRSLPAFAALLAGFVVAVGCVALLAWIAGRIAGAVASGWLGDARAQLVGGMVTALGLLPLAAMAVGHDVARAAVVTARLRAGSAALAATEALRVGAARLAWAWAWRGAAGLALLGCGAVLAAELGGRGGAALVAVAAAHQVVVLGRVALRASWLARAARAVPQVAARLR